VSLNVTPAHRAAIDREHAEFNGYVSQLVEVVATFETVSAAERTALTATAINAGLRGTDAERANKAIAIAAVAIERLSRQAKETTA
jgi:ribosome-associated translation inhibitor RaiA